MPIESSNGSVPNDQVFELMSKDNKNVPFTATFFNSSDTVHGRAVKLGEQFYLIKSIFLNRVSKCKSFFYDPDLHIVGMTIAWPIKNTRIKQTKIGSAINVNHSVHHGDVQHPNSNSETEPSDNDSVCSQYYEQEKDSHPTTSSLISTSDPGTVKYLVNATDGKKMGEVIIITTKAGDIIDGHELQNDEFYCEITKSFFVDPSFYLGSMSFKKTTTD